MKALVVAGGDPNVRDEFGIHEAASCSRIVRPSSTCTEAIKVLVDAGSGPNERIGERGGDHAGATPLHFAARYGTAESVRVLIAAGGDPNARNLHGETPLHRWASSPFLQRNGGPVGPLLDAGADATARNAAGETAWDILQKNENLDDVKRSDDYWRLNDARFGRPPTAERTEPDAR